MTGITRAQPALVGGTLLTWGPVPGATSYVVTVTVGQDPKLVWAWSGTTTAVSYGDTSIDGVSGSAADAWPALANGAPRTWTILALDAHGKIVGAVFRASP
jgi:hypothetical protein